MKTKKFVLLVAALCALHVLPAQQEKLPVIKARSNQAEIKTNGVVRSTWTIVPELHPDVWKTREKEVTFCTDVDSLSFTINPKVKKEYDFIVLLNEKDSAFTRIQYGRESLDPKDLITLDFFALIPVNKPQNFTTKGFNRGFRASFSYPFPLGRSNYYVGVGLGIGFYNYYTSLLDKELSYKKNKLTITYLDVPLVLHYRSPKGLNYSVGAKIDFLVNSYTKYKGADGVFGSEKEVKFKKYHIADLAPVTFGPLLRIGWKKLSMYATYSITPVYNSNAGSKLNPICVGLSLSFAD
ncbi:MAG: PorT family protein [Bacteroidetes bacterium]|nr:PorT family protein [Bacteroidota bacterium]